MQSGKSLLSVWMDGLYISILFSRCPLAALLSVPAFSCFAELAAAFARCPTRYSVLHWSTSLLLYPFLALSTRSLSSKPLSFSPILIQASKPCALQYHRTLPATLTMVQFTTLTFISLLSTTALAQTGTISGTGSLPPYPTYSAPYPISNSTFSLGPTGTGVPPTTTKCPPPVTVTVTNSVTVTTTITTSGVTTPPFPTGTGSTGPTGTGTGGTAAPTGTVSAGFGYPYGYYRRALEMRGLNLRAERKEEKRSGWFGLL